MLTGREDNVARLNPFKRQPAQATNAPLTRKNMTFAMPNAGNAGAYRGQWDVERAVEQAVDRVVWVFKSVHAISANAAGLNIIVRNGHPDTGEIITDDPFSILLNRSPNPHQDAFTFRYMLSAQILLSRKGAFIEVTRDRLGRPTAFHLLPPQFTSPIPHPNDFVSSFEVAIPNQPKRYIDSENVIWLGLPHPIDPYQKATPLDSCGLSTEIDWYARLYNRNFLMNDGRPGGILLVDGELDDDDVEELRRRFMGPTGSGVTGAGRVSVIEAQSGTFVDTSTSARDGQYVEAREMAKTETLIAFGTPESVIGNAAGRTFDNADAELEIFWRETMKTHLRLISTGLTAMSGDDPTHHVTFDLSKVAILGRDEREKNRFHLEELRQNAISVDEYRVATGREPAGSSLVYSPLNFVAIGNTETGETPALPMEAGVNGTSTQAPPSAPRIPANKPEADVAASQEKSITLEEDDEMSTSIQKLNAAPESKKADTTASWRAHSEKLLANYSSRQQRVVLEKLKGRKSRVAIDSGAKLELSSIYDSLVWDKQLAEDEEGLILAIVKDLTSNFDCPEAEGVKICKEFERSTFLVNTTTELFIRKALEDFSTQEEIAEKINEGYKNLYKTQSICAELLVLWVKQSVLRAYPDSASNWA